MDAPSFLLEKPTSDYTMVCNAVLRDRSISMRAKGLYALMFSKPDGWIFHEVALQAETIEGRDALRAAMRELLRRGWIQTCRPRDGGKFVGTIYQMKLTTDWRTVGGLTGDGESTTSKTDINNTEEVIPPKSPINRNPPNVQTLQSVLNSFCQTAEASRKIGGSGLAKSSDGTTTVSAQNGKTSTTTGPAATLPAVVSNEIGLQHGALTVAAPRTAAEAEAAALALTGDLLPLSVQSWLCAMEQHSLVAASIPGKHPPAVPTLTGEERAAVSRAVRSLSDVLQPARERGIELEQAITSMFAVMNVYTGDQAKLTLQVMEWCHYLEDFPLFAIRKAAKWAVVSKDRLPSVAAFIADVRLAIGTGVLERRRLLEGLR